MRRVLESFSWEASRWSNRTARLESDAGGPPFICEELQEGLVAYSAEHADMYRRLRVAFEAAWAAVRMEADVFLSRASILDEEA